MRARHGSKTGNTALSFGQALELLKQGKMVTRHYARLSVHGLGGSYNLRNLSLRAHFNDVPVYF